MSNPIPLNSRILATTPKTTPAKPTPIPSADSPGTWRHPRLEEIARRQSATTFTDKDVRTIAYNVALIFVLWLTRFVVRLAVSPRHFSSTTKNYLGWGYLALQLVPVLNILLALRPLWRKKDDLADIPLTSAQRQLLGLPPTPGADAKDVVYSTPPRYSGTPSRSGSVGSRASYSSSPLSGRGSPTINGNLGGSPYSPAGSPLGQKTFGNGTNGNRRSSIGSHSPLGAPLALGASTASSIFSDPGTPTPAAGKRTSVGLNSKWLYERGRRSSGSAWLH